MSARSKAPRTSRTLIRFPTVVLALAVATAAVAGGCGSARSPRSDAAASASDSSSVADSVSSGAPMDTGTTVDPGSLPQTHDRPGTADAAFAGRTAALWRAVVDDDPQEAMPFFFPLSAYLQVKALPDPARDWQNRLVAAYTRDIHAMHASLHGAGDTATLVGLDVPDAAARWVNPGEESNKLGYWRVYGSNLAYTEGGQAHLLPIYSLISWRGEWYVVHVTHP